MKRIVVVGCLEETLDTLSYLYHLGERIDALISLRQEEANIAGISNWIDLQPFSVRHQLPLYYVDKYSMNTESDYKLIKGLNPEAILVIGWQRLLPEKIVEISTLGCVGFHGSENLLPWGRGRSPINWSIIEGRNRFILHMFFITPGIDDGDIIGFEIYDIQHEDTCRSVYYKTAIAQARLINRFLPKILEGDCPRYPQIGEEFHYPKRTPKDGKINWNLPARDICRLIRAVTHPYPGAFTTISNQTMFIWRGQYFGDNLLTAHARPGEIVFVSSNNFREIVVQCGQGAILVSEYDTPILLQRGDIFDV
ncbi:MAG: methionyl-tRNA formyltransferase [Thermodesulfobacteriota bacterium]